MNRKIECLNGAVLKIIAMIAMTFDHVGLILLDDYRPFRIIGRLAFPIFAYLLAEGCFYTKHKKRHFLEVFLVALVCQIGYFVAEGDMYLNVLFTFSLSIPLVYLLFAVKNKKAPAALFLGAVALVIALCVLLERVGVYFDYGYAGVLLPVFAALGNKKSEKLLLTAVGLLLLAFIMQGNQWWGLMALLPIALYDGTRGRVRNKYAFYVFYPLHMIVIYGISMLIY